MGFEMIKRMLVVTPQRMYSLVRCVSDMPNLTREELQDLLQPDGIMNNQDTSIEVYRYARRLALVTETETSPRHVCLVMPPAATGGLDAFRIHMQGQLLGVTEESQDNYLLSQFTAWYAAQDEKVMEYSKADFEAKFHEALYPTASERVLAEEPGISAWRTWAEFLGWGWPLKFGQREEAKIVPDATLRIRPLLPRLLPDGRVEVPFASFVARLGAICPELDGGVLYGRCWEAARGGEARGNRVSLMVSTALRVLNQEGAIRLVDRRDVADNWALFPAQSHITRVTHVRREGA
jgi:hypothetical protein